MPRTLGYNGRALMRAVVVGAGVFGAWTAYHLQAAGAHVTLVDAYGPANSKASSGDESRITRCGYGPDEIYTRWAHDSLVHWRALFERIGTPADAPLFHESGVLWLSRPDAYTEATFGTLIQCGYRVLRLAPADLTVRFPQVRAGDLDYCLFEPNGGVLMARRAVQSLVRHLERTGVLVLRAQAFAPAGAGRIRNLRLTAGDPVAGDLFVFACGPWLPRVFPELLGGVIRPTRQVVAYFAAPPGDDGFGPARLPAWVNFDAGVYGVPDLEHRGVKVGLDQHGPPFDPDRDDRIADAESIATMRGCLAQRLPALATAPVVETRVCQYENTDTGDFLIDRHPEFDNVWIAGGGSGHGFKHGPAVGEYVARLVGGAIEPEPRFALTAKGKQPRRAVY
jgi:glycine/D-amino acid oxidase-like deaminating enzyme